MQTFEEEHYPSETPVRRVMRELADARAGKEITDRFISEDLPFLFDLQQYQHSSTRERRGDIIEPVDSAVYANWQQRKGTVLANAPVHIRTKPVDKEATPAAANLVKHFLNYQLNDNRYVNYAEVRERWVGASLAARVGVYRWDYVPYLGAGEVIPVLVDVRNLFFPQGYYSPHDPLCPRLHEVFRIPINEARRMKNWKHTADLQPDRGVELLEWLQHRGNDGDHYYGENRNSDSGMGGDGMATFCMTWYRFEFDEVTVERDIDLEPGMRFAKCLDCEFKTPREYEIGELMGDPDYRLPAQEECAKCGGRLRRVAKETKSDEQVTFEQGKRLVITCLNGSVNEALYDDAWPAPDCPSFPYAWLPCEKEPHRAIPESDVSVGRNQTIARNFTLAAIYQQAHTSRSRFIFPRRGIEDANSLGLEDMDELADVMFYTGDFPERGVITIEGLPVNKELLNLWQMLHNISRENEAGSRISMGAEQSKDIPVGTLKQLMDSGNVPNNMFIMGLYSAESLSFTFLLCYLRKFGTEKQWIQFRSTTGKQGWDLVRGVDLPGMNVICSAGPDFSNVTSEETQAMQQFAALPPPLRRIYGRAQGIDEVLLDELDEAQAQMIPPVVPGAPGAADPGMPPPPQPDQPPVPQPPEMAGAPLA